jgi:hypothetical protein
MTHEGVSVLRNLGCQPSTPIFLKGVLGHFRSIDAGPAGFFATRIVDFHPWPQFRWAILGPDKGLDGKVKYPKIDPFEYDILVRDRAAMETLVEFRIRLFFLSRDLFECLWLGIALYWIFGGIMVPVRKPIICCRDTLHDVVHVSGIIWVVEFCKNLLCLIQRVGG